MEPLFPASTNVIGKVYNWEEVLDLLSTENSLKFFSKVTRIY